VHPPGKEDKIKGYELIHDFLSRRFFERLSPEARKIKTLIDIFRRAFRDWKQDGVLVSEDRLEMFFDIRDKLSWGDEECEFVLRSSFITYWYSENKWVKYFNSEIVIRICFDILKGEENAKVMKGAIQTLGDTKEKRVVKPLIKIIEEDKRDNVRETAIDQFWFDLVDARIIGTLLKILKNEGNYKLRKSAVYALSKYKGRRVVNALVESLHDSRANVRAESAYALGKIHDKSTIEHLIGALETEYTKRACKNIIAALGKFLDDERVKPLLKSVVENDKEEYEVRQEAKWVLGRGFSL
jgi:HEAT repeat protein